MSVSRERVAKQLPETLKRMASATAHTEFYLLDSRRDSGHLYHGDSVSGLMEAVAAWQPSGGTHDPAPSLRLARGLAGREGTLIYVTDHDTKDLPSAARLLALGQPENNTGIAGVTTEETSGRTVWRAVLKNYSTAPQTREWWTTSGETQGEHHSVTLPPQGMQNVQSAFAEDQTEVTLHLTPDKFTADDTAPLVRPHLRQLAVLLPQDELALPQEQQLYTALFNSLPGVTVTADRAATDVMVAHYDPLDPALPDKPACIFVRDPRNDAPVLTGTLLVEQHALTDNLNWQSLLVEDALSIPAKTGDEVLIWQSERPLLFLRGPAEKRLICFNFDLRKSNARRLPAFVIGIHRFLEDVRRRIVREEWRNVECGQRLNCPVETGAGAAPVTLTWKATGDGKDGSVTVPALQAGLLTAPDVPALLELKQGDRLLLKSAAHFADVREADFTTAASRQELEGVQSTLVQRHSRADGAWRLWMLALIAVLATAWYFINRPLERRRGVAV
jgi:hypothetical protein